MIAMVSVPLSVARLTESIRSSSLACASAPQKLRHGRFVHLDEEKERVEKDEELEKERQRPLGHSRDRAEENPAIEWAISSNLLIAFSIGGSNRSRNGSQSGNTILPPSLGSLAPGPPDL